MSALRRIKRKVKVEILSAFVICLEICYQAYANIWIESTSFCSIIARASLKWCNNIPSNVLCSFLSRMFLQYFHWKFFDASSAVPGLRRWCFQFAARAYWTSECPKWFVLTFMNQFANRLSVGGMDFHWQTELCPCSRKFSWAVKGR